MMNYTKAKPSTVAKGVSCTEVGIDMALLDLRTTCDTERSLGTLHPLPVDSNSIRGDLQLLDCYQTQTRKLMASC